MCGRCCHEVPFVEDECSYKRIPLYPEEADRLETFAEQMGIELHLVEDLVFPDELNQQIIVVTWRIMLDNDDKVCPFHDPTQGCLIHDAKPRACQSYPLALQIEDAFNTKIEIDPLCEFTIQNRDRLEKATAKEIEEIYESEFPHVRNQSNRNKRIQFKLKGMEQTGEARIPREISAKDYDECLQNWSRKELR